MDLFHHLMIVPGYGLPIIQQTIGVTLDSRPTIRPSTTIILLLKETILRAEVVIQIYFSMVQESPMENS